MEVTETTEQKQQLQKQQRISYTFLGLALLTPVYLRALCCPLLVLWARDRSAHPNRVFFLSLLPVPPLSRSTHSQWWAYI